MLGERSSRSRPALLALGAALIGLVGCRENDPEATRPRVVLESVDLATISWLPGEVLHSTFDARDLTRCGDTLVATGHPGVMSLSLGGGGDPVVVETPGEARHAACLGEGLLVADGYAGLAVVADGAIQRRYDLGGTVTWVAVEGERVVVVLEEGILAVLDLETGTGPADAEFTMTGAVVVPGAPRFVGFATPDLLWVVGYSHGVALVDTSTPDRPEVVESWRGLRKSGAFAAAGGRLVLSDVSRQTALLEIGPDDGIVPRAVFPTEGWTTALSLRGTRVAMSDGETSTVLMDVGKEGATEVARFDRASAVLMGAADGWFGISEDGEWARFDEGRIIRSILRVDPHRPARLVAAEGRILSLSGRGCDGIEVTGSAAPLAVERVLEIAGAECRSALYDEQWVVGGTTGVYGQDGTRIRATRTTDLRSLEGPDLFALAIEEQKGVVLVRALDQEGARPQCGPSILGAILVPIAPGKVAAIDGNFAHATVVSANDPDHCELIPLQGPAVDVWETPDRLFVAEKLYGVEVFDRQHLSEGAVGYLPLPATDVKAVVATGDRLILGLGPQGVAVYAREGARIGEQTGAWETAGSVTDLAVLGGQLLVADGSSLRSVGLEAIR